MASFQNEQSGLAARESCMAISNVALPNADAGQVWHVEIKNNTITKVAHRDDVDATDNAIDGKGGILLPSLCHPHVHLDKAYLLAHPRYPDYEIHEGTFEEALKLTNEAKSSFTDEDLRDRGERVIDESIAAGVTHMRAFVELDNIVNNKCLEAGLKLKQQYESAGICKIQLCAYAQLPLFRSAADDTDGHIIRALMSQAAAMNEVGAIGSTPYVEEEMDLMRKNIDWLIDLSIKHNKHLDFHLDYDIDKSSHPTIWYVLQRLKEKQWLDKTTNKTIVLGHCTRLTLWTKEEWTKLAKEIGNLPISFCGLPTSDLYMLRNEKGTAMTDQSRCTLDVVKLLAGYKINACLGINNIGNAFTPQGNCDPMLLACNGVGLYQAGPVREAELLFECISSRARQAIGYESRSQKILDSSTLDIKAGGPANLMLLPGNTRHAWRTRKTVSEAVYLYDGGAGRQTILEGQRVVLA